ncbi:MAG: saccharopine dehydrogenase family protein [Spirochaetales bacterium]
MKHSVSDRDIDILHVGATGFAGKLVAERFLAAKAGDPSLRIVFAGRSAERTQAAIAECATRVGATPEGVPECIEVDVSTPSEDLDQLVGRSSVVCTTVGPYSRLGEPLVAACAKSGTDYVDLTGEVHWIAAMIARYHDTARASGARIVHACGFDSVPSDIGLHAAAEQFRERYGEEPDTGLLYLGHSVGGFSGGTVESMLEVLQAARRDPRVRQAIKDPLSLAMREEPPERQTAGSRSKTDCGIPQTMIARDSSSGLWSVPFFMGAINEKVVARSRELERGDAASFCYAERIPTGRGVSGFLRAIGTQAALGMFMGLLTLGPARWVLRRFVLPKPGSGPRVALERRGEFSVSTTVWKRENVSYADVDTHATARGRHSSVTATVSSNRDPGYGATAIMLCESALCLLDDSRAVTQGSAGRESDAQTNAGGTAAAGVLTPAVAMGANLRQRLTAAGVRVSVE